MTNNDEDYIGSEQHFRDIQAAARKSTACNREPETLGEAVEDFARAWDDLMKALGVYRLADRILVAIGKILIKMGFKNE